MTENSISSQCRLVKVINRIIYVASHTEVHNYLSQRRRPLLLPSWSFVQSNPAVAKMNNSYRYVICAFEVIFHSRSFNYFTFTLFSDVLLPTSEQPSLLAFFTFFIIIFASLSLSPHHLYSLCCTLLIGHQH